MENLITTFHPTHFLQESGSGYYGSKCVICEKEISPPYNWGSPPSDYLYCRSCDLYFHKACSTSLLEKLTINRPATHEHTLTFIRKKNYFNCDACGRVDMDEWMKKLNGDHGTYEMNMYACLPCNFFIHRDCIYLPKVIKLTLHSHRLFHFFQVANYNTRCRLCYNSFGCGSGGYICVHEKCFYILHSHCATKKELWDGRDLEGEPEETSNSEDVKSLKEVDDGETFHHFSHQHDLTRLCVNGEEEEGDERVCQACILPVDFDSFLGCKECDFALHDTCASLPRKLEHTFHRHPLTLEVDMTNIKEGFFSCSKCERESCGFMYRCCQEECDFKMDAKCASLANPVYNKAHQHPLTLFDNGARCLECPSGGVHPLFYLHSNTATLPMLVKNKYDTHPLTLCIRKSDIEFPSSLLRCEICEIRINTYYPDFQNLYGCFDCNTIVHVECAIGKYPYLKPGHTIKLNGFEIEIASNSLSRPVCHACHSTCQDKLVFKDKSSAISFCSINCITSSKKTLMQSYGV